MPDLPVPGGAIPAATHRQQQFAVRAATLASRIATNAAATIIIGVAVDAGAGGIGVVVGVTRHVVSSRGGVAVAL
jgi:hypothetical protein